MIQAQLDYIKENGANIVVEYTNGEKELFYLPLRMMRGEKPNETDIKRTVLRDWTWVEPTYNLVINKPASQIKSITIDPTQRLADINTENNSFDVASMLSE